MLGEAERSGNRTGLPLQSMRVCEFKSPRRRVALSK